MGNPLFSNLLASEENGEIHWLVNVCFFSLLCTNVECSMLLIHTRYNTSIQHSKVRSNGKKQLGMIKVQI